MQTHRQQKHHNNQKARVPLRGTDHATLHEAWCRGCREVVFVVVCWGLQTNRIPWKGIHGVIQGTVPQLRARGSAMLRWSACFYERHGPDGAPCGLPWVTRRTSISVRPCGLELVLSTMALLVE